MRTLLLAALLLLVACAPAQAGPGMEVGIADDRVMLHGTDDDAREAVAEWKRLGIDVVRVHARWVSHVPSPNARTKPRGFDQRNPLSRGYNWGALDRAVTLARGAGMRVMLTVTGSGPVWGTMAPGVGSQRYKPSPTSFAQFATAVARRYGRQVDDYIIWNEPNHELWIQPQNTCSGGRCTPYAPHLYRKLVLAADPAIRTADPGARVIIGALAPRGTSGRGRNHRLRPLAFLRAMGCVDRSYRRVRTGPCRGFKPAAAAGFAFHPHGLKLAPTAASDHPDEAQLGDLSKLVSGLDRLTRAGGLRARHHSGRFPLWLDEYGYQTNPPDRILGVSQERQAMWIQQAAYLAWTHPRVRNLTQYAWKDEPLLAGGAGWQSGLRDARGRAKSLLAVFPHPFWAERRTPGTVRLWGQIRPAGYSSVAIERRTATGRWALVTRVGTDPRGYFTRDLRTRSRGSYRFRYGEKTSSVRTV